MDEKLREYVIGIKKEIKSLRNIASQMFEIFERDYGYINTYSKIINQPLIIAIIKIHSSII